MPTEMPRILLEVNYYQAAQEYLRKLPLEHHMESISQSTQRKITLASLELVHAQRPEVQLFSELLVQYPNPQRKVKKPRQVVPDNMIVLHDQPIKAEGSYDVPLQPVGPFWTLEYVSKSNPRKDYDDNMVKYERELKVPYYLLFLPNQKELTLYRHTGEKYVTVIPDERGLCPITELELQVGLHDGWLRYWFRGELLPLPADLLQKVQELRHQLQQKDEQLQQKDEQLQQKDKLLQESARLVEEERRRAETFAAELAELRKQLPQRDE